MTVRRSKKRWGLLAAGGILAGAASAAVWVRRQFVAITVEGMSMSPALYDGEKVLIRRGIRGLQPGRIVVLSRPDPVSGWRHNPPAGRDLDATSWYIKRVVAVGGEPYPKGVSRSGLVPSGHVVVVGDHPHSEDSKQHGPCPIDQILGIQVRKLSVSSPVSSMVSTPSGWPDDIDALTLDPGDLTEGIGAVETVSSRVDGFGIDGSGAEVQPVVEEAPEAPQPRVTDAESPATEAQPPATQPDPAPETAEAEPKPKKAAKKAAKKSAKKTAKKAATESPVTSDDQPPAKKAAKKASKKTAKQAAKKTAKKAAKKSTKKSTDQ